MPFAATLGLSPAQILRDLGYAGLALLMAAETVFPPIPSEAVLPLAGYLAQQGEFTLAGVMVTATLGSVAGSALLYEAARHGGRPFADRFLRFARQDPEKLDRAEEWFGRRGALVVLFGRFVPGVRSVVALPAGILRMPRWEYLLLTLIGSAAWNAVLIGAGYLLGSQWHRVADVVGPLSIPLIAALVLAAGGWLLWRGLRNRDRDRDRV